MRETDNFAYGPKRARRKALPMLGPIGVLGRALRPSLAFAAGLLAWIAVASLLSLGAWTLLIAVRGLRFLEGVGFALGKQAYGVFRSLEGAGFALGRLIYGPGPRLANVRLLLRSNTARELARLGSVARRTIRAVASWEPPAARSVRRWVRSRRATALLAAMIAVFLMGGLLPASAVAGDISTVAGRPDAGDGGSATSALLKQPNDVAVGPGGNVYVADTYNHRIRRISTAGVITTVAGTGTSGFSGDGGAAVSAQLRFPEGIWLDGSGNIYIADTGNHRVRMVTTTGTISTIAGTGTAGFSGDGGPATAARLNGPKDVVTDSSGNLYVADTRNHRIRRVNPGGTITTYAGNGTEGYAGDGGAATGARLNDPNGVGVNGSGQLYIADTDNHRVRLVSASGIISTIAGTGQQGDSTHPTHGDKSQLSLPRRVATSGTTVYVADSGNSKVKLIGTWGDISTVAGSATTGFSGDGGPATSAALDTPLGIGVGSGGIWFVADSGNQRIRRIASGNISTFAGRDHFGGDAGPATSATLDAPRGVGADSSGNIYVADTDNHRVRRVSSGIISTVAGTGTAGSSGDGGAATSAQLREPNDIAVDAGGNVYIADTGNHKIRKIDPAGNMSTVAGTGVAGFSGNGAAATAAQLNGPRGVEVDSAGNVYVADTGNHRIRRISATGVITTVAGSGTAAFCGDGGAATSACLELPMDVAVASSGNLYIADYGNNRIRSVISGTIRTLAGNGSASFSGDGGPANQAALNSPMGVEVDGGGGVVIADSMNNRIRVVSPGGAIRTVGGTGVFGFSGDGGPAISSQMAFPAHISLDPSGNLLLADLYNDRIRMIEKLALPGPVLTGTTPASPANDNTPLVRGNATPGTTVNIYKNSTCTGAPAASGGASTFASPGIEASVPDNSTTSFYASVTDANGGVSACSTAPVVYVEDSTPPATPSISSETSSPGSDQTPSWSFTIDAGARAECELSRNGSTIFSWASCSSPHMYDLSSQGDGTYVLGVRAVDAAGNQGPVSNDTYVLDSTLPAGPVITVAPVTPGDDTTPTWEFTLEAGSTAECELSYEGAVVDPFAPCNSPHTVNLNGDPDGRYTFRVQSRDGAGNVSAPVSSGYTLDTTDPAPPSIGTSPSSPGSSTTPGWEFSVELGATAECELRRGATVVSAWQPCLSPDTHDLSGEPDGDYLFSVRAVDFAGNVGPIETSSYTLDTRGPQVNITSAPSSPDSALNPSWSFTSEPGAALECELRNSAGVVAGFASCATSESYDLAGQPDGAYTFAVHATDAAGNTGDPATSVYVLDTTPPAVAIISGPAAFSSEQAPEWTFTSEAGVGTECELSSASAGVLVAFTPCVSPEVYDLSSRPHDTYTFQVPATDSAGNLGPASSASYSLDRSGPAASISSSPQSPGNSLAPSWSFTAESGSTAECTLSGPSGALSPWTPCAGAQSYNLTGQPDGTYTFSVRATDVAMNVGAPASSSYILDRTAPTVSITSSSTSPSNLRTPSWSFTTEAGASTECELSRGGAVIAPWGSCASPVSVSLNGQPDGTYTMRVRAVDAAGNVGPAAPSNYTLDTTGPAVSVTAPSSPSSNRSPAWTFSTEAGAAAECELSRGGVVLQAFAPCTSPAGYDLNVQPDGTYTVSVKATDPAGNTGATTTSTYVLDTGGPAVTIVGGPQSPGSTTTVSWAFTTEPGARTECQLTQGTNVVQAFTTCSGSKAYQISSGADGDYTFTVRATDAAGNTGPGGTGSYTLDRTPPSIPVITSSPASPDLDRSVVWTFTAEPGSSTECELSRSGSVVRPFAQCSGSAEYDVSSEPDGDYTFSVRASDSLGNMSAPVSSGYTLDTTGPEVSFTAEPKSPAKDRAPAWEFVTEAGAEVSCVLSRGGTEIHSDGICQSPVSFDLAGEPDGIYSLKVKATDAARNEGATATSRYVLDTTDSGLPEAPAPEPEPEQPSRPAPEPVEEEAEEEAEAVPASSPRRIPPADPDRGEEDSPDPVPEPEEAREVSERPRRATGALGEFLSNVGTVAAGLLEQPAFPLGLIGLVFGFLVLQNRVDSRDPKLAMAPIYPDPHLYFAPSGGPGISPKTSNTAWEGPMT